jgi:hypothetical protein
MVEPSAKLKPAAEELMNDANLNPLAKAIHQGEIVAEEKITSLFKTGSGRRCDVYNLDKKLSVKFYRVYKVGDIHPLTGVEIKETEVAESLNADQKKAADSEYNNLLVCQCPWVI